MKYRNYRRQAEEVIEEEFEVYYDFENSAELYIGRIDRVQTKLSEKVCKDPKILELFKRRIK